MFAIQTHQQPWVNAGTTRMTAVVEVTNLSESASVATTKKGLTMVGDDSNSMNSRAHALHVALNGAIDVLDESIDFSIVRFSGLADRIFPEGARQFALPATAANKKVAKQRVRSFTCNGSGTYMGTALEEVETIIANSEAGSIQQVLFLTDGEENNTSNPQLLPNVVERLRGKVRVDVRIIGDGANVVFMRDTIATPLGGQVAVIKNNADMAEDFRKIFGEAMSVAFGDVKLVFSCLKTGKIVSVEQLDPKLDLKAVQQGTDFIVNTTAWKPGEHRIYRVVAELIPLPGKEHLFASMTTVGREFNLVQPKITWTEGGKPQEAVGGTIVIGYSDDSDKTLATNPVVAIATGQVELVDQKQRLAQALREHDDATTTHAVNRILKLVEETGDARELDETTRALNHIGVEVGDKDDEGTRSVNVRRVEKVNLDDYDAQSTSTRVRQVAKN